MEQKRKVAWCFLFFQMSSLRHGFQDPSRTEDSHWGETLWCLLQVLHLSSCLQDFWRLWSASKKQTQCQQNIPCVSPTPRDVSKVQHFFLLLIFTVFSFFCRLIFKCSCETIFKKKQLLFQHFHQNANKRVTSVFKCPECNSVFPQKQLLMQHVKVRALIAFFLDILCLSVWGKLPGSCFAMSDFVTLGNLHN